ncbi:U3 small nucleolar RNA-associated protein 25 homolog [Babylonia areolata]|uniref:U3 small nucleolar RNA-associated protein 25 homolog n=1 Tax=Babylonia areolata TaxID=304850 RepID=UPI003FD2AAE4
MGKRRHNKHNNSLAKLRRVQEMGEVLPADFGDSVRRYAKIEEEKEEIESSSSSAESEEETVVQQIFKNLGVVLDAEETDSSEGEDEEEEEEEGGGEVGSEELPEGENEDDEGQEGNDDDSESEDEDANDTQPAVKKRKITDTSEGNEAEEEGSEDGGDDNDSDANSDEGSAVAGDAAEEEGEKDKEEEEVLDEGEEEMEHQLKEDDPFSIHFEKDLPEQVVERLSSTKWQEEAIKVKAVGPGRLLWKNSELVSKEFTVQKDLKKLGVKHKVAGQVTVTNEKVCGTSLKKPEDGLTPFQHGLFSIINKYQDLLYPRQSHDNSEKIRLTYCLHAVNHVLKTRSRVIAHNTKLKNRAESGDSSEVEYRDQGLTRPKVLVVVPTRHVAYRVVSIIISLLSSSDQEMVSKRKRFKAEFGPEGHDDDQKGLKPDDYNVTFAGNIDEHFRIGLSVSKKSLRLYSPFYMADIIIASPLGLRTIIGAPGDRDRDYDFLSSIEVMILDQTDFFLMQNWDHVLHLFDHMHLQPRQAHNMDFTRSRMWALNGWSQHYRQTLIFSSLLTPEIFNVFKVHCHNYCGRVEVSTKPAQGSVCQVYVQLPQMFHRLDCDSPADISEARFQFFLKEVLPQHKEKDMKQTLIFIPNYFDFVRIRNHFKKEAISFTHINEYATSKGIRRARIEFKRRRSHFMLYTERVHFYRRFKLRGIRHIVFYALPQYPQFYAEMCNLLSEPGRMSVDMLTCTVIYSRFDLMRLTEVVGTARARQMAASSKTVHMLVSGDTS